MKKQLEKYLEKLNKEIETAEKYCDEAIENCKKHHYSENSYQYYQQRCEYLKGLYMAKSLLENEVNK